MPIKLFIFNNRMLVSMGDLPQPEQNVLSQTVWNNNNHTNNNATSYYNNINMSSSINHQSSSNNNTYYENRLGVSSNNHPNNNINNTITDVVANVVLPKLPVADYRSLECNNGYVDRINSYYNTSVMATSTTLAPVNKFK